MDVNDQLPAPSASTEEPAVPIITEFIHSGSNDLAFESSATGSACAVGSLGVQVHPSMSLSSTFDEMDDLLQDDDKDGSEGLCSDDFADMEKAAILLISEVALPQMRYSVLRAKADRNGYLTECSDEFIAVSGLTGQFRNCSIVSLAKYTTPEQLQQHAYMLDKFASSKYVAPEPGTAESKWVAELDNTYMNSSYEIIVTLSPTADTNASQALDVHLKEISTSGRSSFLSLTRHHSTRDLSNLRILVVDDSAVVLKMVSRIIQEEGHVVDCKKDGLEAVDALKNIEYDAVLMDIHMPEMGGLEASFEFRTHEGLMLQYRSEAQSNKLKIIAMSADTSEDLKREVIRAGFDGFIPKPFTVEAFRNLKLKSTVFR